MIGAGGRRQRGSVLAEFAVCIPVILLMVLGAIDFGRVWTLATASANAAQAGAQYGAQSVPLSADLVGIRAAVVSDLQSSVVLRAGADDGGPVITDFTITPERYCECSNGVGIGCTDTCFGGAKPLVFVSVQVASTFKTLFDYPGIPSEIPVTRAAVLRAR